MASSVQNLTLREVFSNAERVSRELTEHVELGFLPKANALARLLRPSAGGAFDLDVGDLTVRNHVQAVLDSHAFAEGVSSRLNELYQAVDTQVGQIASGG